MQRPSSVSYVIIFFRAIFFNWHARRTTPSYQEYEAIATMLLHHDMPRKAKNMAEKGEMIRRAWRERNHDPLFEALLAIAIAKADAKMGNMESAHSHSIRPERLLQWFHEQATSETDNVVKYGMYKNVERVGRGLYEFYSILGDQERAGYFMSLTYEAMTILSIKREWEE